MCALLSRYGMRMARVFRGQSDFASVENRVRKSARGLLFLSLGDAGYHGGFGSMKLRGPANSQPLGAQPAGLSRARRVKHGRLVQTVSRDVFARRA